MQVAFYKGTQSGLQGLVNRVVRWWTGGPFSHCELVFSDAICASSSLMDKGVRFKQIDVSTDDWQLIDVGGDESAARAWFEANVGKPYDLSGDFGFVWRPLRSSRSRFFCSEAVAYSLGFPEAYRFDPNTLSCILGRGHVVYG